MIYLKTEEEIDLLRAANRLVSATLTEIAKIVKPGVSVKALDTLAEQYIRDHGAVPTFKGFPADIPVPTPSPVASAPRSTNVWFTVYPMNVFSATAISSPSTVEPTSTGFAATPPTHSVSVR